MTNPHFRAIHTNQSYILVLTVVMYWNETEIYPFATIASSSLPHKDTSLHTYKKYNLRMLWQSNSSHNRMLDLLYVYSTSSEAKSMKVQAYFCQEIEIDAVIINVMLVYKSSALFRFVIIYLPVVSLAAKSSYSIGTCFNLHT